MCMVKLREYIASELSSGIDNDMGEKYNKTSGHETLKMKNHFGGEEEEDEKGSTWPQFVAGIAANISAVISGCIIGWTSPSLPKLESGLSGIKITKEENSWISSLTPLAAGLGPFAAGYLADRYGKKRTLITSALPALISWICLAVAKSVELIYVGRFIAGFTVGWIFTVLPMYCGEIAEDSVRGAIGSLMQVFICIGLFFDYVVGPYVSYTMLSVTAGAFPFLFALAFYWMPESPYSLLGSNNFEAAKKSLMWLRDKSEDGVDQELESMQAEVEYSKTQTGTFKDLVATKGTTKALVLSLGLVGFQQFSVRGEVGFFTCIQPQISLELMKSVTSVPPPTVAKVLSPRHPFNPNLTSKNSGQTLDFVASGINAVLFNAEPIFRRAGGSIQPEVATIIVGAVMLVASAATPLVVDRLGRRVLLLVSAFGMGIAQGVLGLYFYLDSTGTDTSTFSFLPVIAMLVYIIVYSIGFGPLPWAIMGEMFPSNIKSLASTLTASFAWFLGFLVTRFFNNLLDFMGNHFTFWLFGIFCFGAIFFVSFLLPETKGKSLVEIQEILNS